MPRPDAHNACPACPQAVRELYYAAQQLVDALDGDLSEVDVMARITEVRASVRAFAPFIDAHHANQDHVLSAKLAPAREPVCR